MRVFDAQEREALAAARELAGRESWRAALMAGLTAVMVWLAVTGVGGVEPLWLWVAVGFMAAGAADAVCGTAEMWWELRALRSCRACLLATADRLAFESQRADCAAAGHQQVTE